MVSYRVSPLDTDVPMELKFSTDPPSLFMAVSKDILVLVEFSKNMFARTLPCRRGRIISPLATGRSLSASSSTETISSLVRSSIVTRLPMAL